MAEDVEGEAAVQAGGANALLGDELRQLAETGAAVLVFAASGDRVIWATPAGAALLGVAAPAALDDLVFGPDRIPVRRIAQLAQGLAPLAGARLERMRVVVGRRVEMLTLACRRAELSSGEAVLVAISAGRKPSVSPGGHPVPVPSALLAGRAEAVEAAPDQAPGGELTIESLRARAGGRQIVRFVWQVDEQGRFAASAAELAVLVGEERSIRQGDDLPALLARGVEDADDRFAKALTAGTTFTGVDLVWPVGDSGQGIVVSMSGVPIVDRERNVKGFRGFGLCRLDMLVPVAPAASAAAEIAPIQETASEAETSPEPAASHEAAAPSQEPTPAALPPPVASTVVSFEAARNATRQASDDKKVVPLRSGQPPRVSPAGLSRSERQAFREIARALGARVEGDEEEPARAEQAVPADLPVVSGEGGAAAANHLHVEAAGAPASDATHEASKLLLVSRTTVAGTLLPPSLTSSWRNWRKANSRKRLPRRRKAPPSQATQRKATRREATTRQPKAKPQSCRLTSRLSRRSSPSPSLRLLPTSPPRLRLLRLRCMPS